MVNNFIDNTKGKILDAETDIKNDISNLKNISLGSYLFQMILMYLVLLITGIFLRKISIFIILFEFLIFTAIQIFTNLITTKEFYFLFTSTILFIIFFVILQRTQLSDKEVNKLLIILLCYVNWYYISTLIFNLLK